MGKNVVSVNEYFIHLLFALYFMILPAERVQSLVRSACDPATHWFSDAFNGYVYTVTVISLCVSVVYILITNSNLFAGIFTRNAEIHNGVRMGPLCIAAGMILVSGMVHTEYTVAPVQFGAYGALIVAMIIQTAVMQNQSSRPVLLWLSVAFLTAFSMAIPVMYRSGMANAAVIHVLEAVTSLVLVGLFTAMLFRVFSGDATDLFGWIPMLTAIVLDGILLFLQRNGEINRFVLVALAFTCILFCAGVITKRFVH